MKIKYVVFILIVFTGNFSMVRAEDTASSDGNFGEQISAPVMEVKRITLERTDFEMPDDYAQIDAPSKEKNSKASVYSPWKERCTEIGLHIVLAALQVKDFLYERIIPLKELL
jgi:hypothetical protein